jgi:fatty-acyl-CoA synthase/benzoate-CoA ligase/fatty acid CoA ligase FadD22
MAGAPVSRPAWRCNVSEFLLDRPFDPSCPALRSPHGELSRGELATRVGAVASGLAQRGVRRGTRVALALPDSPSWVVAFLALARLGAVVAFASPTLPETRLRDAVMRAGPDLLLSDDDQIAREVPLIEPEVIDHLIDLRGTDSGPAPTRAADPCYLLLTSGSTGPPKWAIHSHGDIAACLGTPGRHVLALRPTDVT